MYILLTCIPTCTNCYSEHHYGYYIQYIRVYTDLCIIHIHTYINSYSVYRFIYRVCICISRGYPITICNGCEAKITTRNKNTRSNLDML